MYRPVGNPLPIPINVLRQGSNELDSSCSRERSNPVMLSAAKHLAADRDRPFAVPSLRSGLRLTQGDMV